MFCFFNNLRSSWQNKAAVLRDSRSGQVAVIMIVVIAIGLVLFASSINLTLLSQAKTSTMNAASLSASSTASFIASYGQKMFVETMGRRLVYCKESGGGGFGLLTLIVMIAIAIYAPQILGAMAAEGTVVTQAAINMLQGAAIVGAVMEGMSLMIASSVDPGISDMWNRMQNANLSLTGQVVERGVQTALQAVVTDQVRLPDLYDLDGDGLFGYPGGDETKPPNDTINRFSLYNTKRYLGLTGIDTLPAQDFVEALHELVVQGTDNWGLWDPVYYPDFKTPASPLNGIYPNSSNYCYLPITDVRRPAECDYCCDNYDPAASFPDGAAVPNECIPASGVIQLGDRSTCPNRTPFRSMSAYPYIYDFSYEDSTNSFMSLREQLGRDDEHHLYHTASLNPNWHSDPVNAPQVFSDTDAGFYLKDVVGYYQNPPFSLGNPDIWVSAISPRVPKLFPFLYKMRDWGVQLSALNYNNYECHWCDSRQPADPGRTCPADMSSYPEISGRLVLPSDPATVPYNTAQGWCVNNTNKGDLYDPPVVPDHVSNASNLFVADDACAINSNPVPIGDINQYHGGWKRGADRYCSNTSGVLYSIDCPKHGVATPPSSTVNPQCGQAGAAPATSWPDDLLDEIVYGMPSLFKFEEILWKTRDGASQSGLLQLAKSLKNWYGTVSDGRLTTDGISDWIEPPCPDPANCPGSFTKLERPGMLWIWREELKWINTQIQNWLVPSVPYNSSGTFGPDDAWCVPLVNGGSPPGEIAAFDVNGNGVRGDVADVIACLRWNAQDVRTYTGPLAAAVGNAQKFQRCHDSCSADTCSNLPRSLIPDFYNGANFISGRPAYQFVDDGALFLTCLTTPSVPPETADNISLCATNCGSLPSGPPYNLPVFVGPNMSKITAIDNYCTAHPTGTSGGMCNSTLLGTTTLNCNFATTNQADCRCSWAGSCAGFAGCILDSTYVTAVTDALGKSSSCMDPAYVAVMQVSANEALIQGAKFLKRADFLQARYDEAMALSNDSADPRFDSSKPDGILTTAVKKLTAFLDNGTPFVYNSAHLDDLTLNDSPAEKLIQYRMYLEKGGSLNGDLPNFGLYVWQDPDPGKTNLAGDLRWGTTEGYWHAVKVEVGIPRRCPGNCGVDDWPKIFSETSTSGGFFSKKTKICYSIINQTGTTLARVIRYDQDKDLRGLVFPGGQKIWDSKLSHPGTGSPDPTGIRAACLDFIDPDLSNWLTSADPADSRRHLGAAFMLNKIPTAGDGSNYSNCWQKVHDALLSHGIQSEACAQYSAIEGSGFRVHFVPCGDW